MTVTWVACDFSLVASMVFGIAWAYHSSSCMSILILDHLLFEIDSVLYDARGQGYTWRIASGMIHV